MEETAVDVNVDVAAGGRRPWPAVAVQLQLQLLPTAANPTQDRANRPSAAAMAAAAAVR